MHPRLPQLVVELAVRKELMRFGYTTQEYSRRGQQFWWRTYGAASLPIVQQEKRRGQKGIPVWHWYLFTHAAGLTGHLYFNLRNAWGFGVERWYRFADATKEDSYFWAGSSSNLTEALRIGTEAIRAEATRVSEWLGGEHLRQDAVYRLTEEFPEVVFNGTEWPSVASALDSIGVRDWMEYVEPELPEEHPA